MIITLEMLENKNACLGQMELFKATFGNVVEVTQENCVKAAKVSLDFEWAVDNLLTRKQRAAYEEAEAPLRAAYEEAEAAQTNQEKIMNKKEIKEMYAAGNSTWEVLAEVIERGVEFPDAVYRVSQALKLDAEETAEMIKKHSTYC